MVAALKKIAELENTLAGVKSQRETLSNQLSDIKAQAGKIQFNEEQHVQERDFFYISLCDAGVLYLESRHALNFWPSSFQ